MTVQTIGRLRHLTANLLSDRQVKPIKDYPARVKRWSVISWEQTPVHGMRGLRRSA